MSKLKFALLSNFVVLEEEKSCTPYQAIHIKERLYESAHSLIYCGRRESDNQSVILKVLQGEYPMPNELARFRREYEMTRHLDLDGVIDVYALEPYHNSLVRGVGNLQFQILTALFISIDPNPARVLNPGRVNTVSTLLNNAVHDCIQQAAYSLIEEVRKQEIHLKIGRLLLSNTPETVREISRSTSLRLCAKIKNIIHNSTLRL